jgi:predicted DCC family thiol-disulfide oxidoreductase YuxK
MKKLTVLYDGECGLCGRARAHFLKEVTYLELEFLDLHDPSVETRFPGIHRLEPEKQLVVIADSGEIYWGADAWIMVLYATRKYRALSLRLGSNAAMKSMAREFCEFVSGNRKGLSQVMGIEPERKIENAA